jgi:hypothetical protein
MQEQDKNLILLKTERMIVISLSKYSGKNLCSVKNIILDNNDSDILQ